MKIEFDTATLDPREARGLTALLAHLGGTLASGGVVSNGWHTGTTYTPPQPVEMREIVEELRDPNALQLETINVAIIDGRAVTIPPPSIEPDGPVLEAIRDANGFEWDARIHSSGRTFNKDNTWRYGKGVAKELIAEVEAELRSAAALEDLAENDSVQLDIEAADPHEELETVEAEVKELIADPTPRAVIPPPPVPAATGPSFQDLMKRIAAEKIPTATVKEICEKIGVAGIANLIKNPEGIVAFYGEIDK